MMGFDRRLVFAWCLLAMGVVINAQGNNKTTVASVTSPVSFSNVTTADTSQVTGASTKTSQLTSQELTISSTSQLTSQRSTTSVNEMTSSITPSSLVNAQHTWGPNALASSQGTPADTATSSQGTSANAATSSQGIPTNTVTSSQVAPANAATSSQGTAASTVTSASSSSTSSDVAAPTLGTSTVIPSSPPSAYAATTTIVSTTTLTTGTTRVTTISSSSVPSTTSSTPSPTTTVTTKAATTAPIRGTTTVPETTASNNATSSSVNTSTGGHNSSFVPVHVPATACLPRWIVYNGLTSSVTIIQTDGAWVLPVAAVTVADCLDECSRHVTCVAVEVNQTSYISPLTCALIFNTTLFANISWWYPTPRLSTYVIERCPDADVYTCRSGYVSSSGGVGSTGGKWVQQVSDLDTCQLTCSLDVTCVGIDYDWQSTSCFQQNNRTTFDGRRYTIGPPSLIQYTKVDACVNTCRPVWNKVEAVSSIGSMQESQCSLPHCIDTCAHNVDCVGIEYNITASSCSFFPSSASAVMISSATPTPSIVQYRLLNSCQTGCVVTWRADVGFRYTLIGASILLNASSLDQCGLYCRQSSTCRIYQVTRPASAPIVCTIASDYVLLSRVADVMFASFIFTEINCSDSSVKSTDGAAVVDPSNTCVGWTTYIGRNVPDGRVVTSANSLTDCQLACVNSSTCTGVDYNPSNPTGQRCFITSSNQTDATYGYATGVNHYSINRTCTGCSVWTVYADSNVFGGTEVPTANNLTACQTSCLNTTDCRGIDYNPRNPAGWRCYQIKDASASISHNVVSGVSHYDVTNNCATVNPTPPPQTSGQCVQTWTVYNNSNAIGGSEISTANTLSDCQSACLNQPTCTGIDYNANNPQGWRCYVFQATLTSINLGITAGVTHYDYNRNCSQGCRDIWTTYLDSNILGGLQLSYANTVDDCMSACLSNDTCTGVDYNAYNLPGQRCFMHFSGTTPRNIGQSHGVTHYHLNRSYAVSSTAITDGGIRCGCFNLPGRVLRAAAESFDGGCSLSWIYYANSNVLGGWQYPQTTINLQQCQAACLQNSTCSAIDLDGSRCFLIPSSPATTINVGRAPGVKHFRLQSNC